MINKLYLWYGRKTVWSVVSLALLLIVVGAFIKFSGGDTEEAAVILPTVKVASVSELSGESSVSIIGTVAAVSEADLKTESSGRITSVPVTLGQTVAAGSVIATLENASERAAVLQAEGVYEAALAAGAASDIGVSEATIALTNAQNNTVSTIRDAYTTNAAVVLNSIDQFFSDPEGYLPGLRLNGGSQTAFLNSERIAYQELLPAWVAKEATLSTNSDLTAEITAAETVTRRTRTIVDTFLQLLIDEDPGRYTKAELDSFQAEFVTLRATLNGTLTQLDAARTTLTAAEETLSRVKIGGTSTEVSTANAQIKQALGSLRAAQANLAKTIVTTPIAGTVNALNVKVGDFVGVQSPVAKVANNNALEITAFVGERDLNFILVGDTVTIDDRFNGTITHIGAGVDSATQKTEVKIATETTELTNGDTVTITIDAQSAPDEDSTLVLPITAVRFAAEDGFVLTVEDGIIVENPITLGSVRGSYVEVVSGVTPQMQIVIDARGLTAGTKVESN